MPSKLVKGDDGQMYVEIPGVGRVLATQVPSQPAGDPNEDMLVSNAKAIGKFAMNPEVLAGLAGILATGGAGTVPLAASTAGRFLIPPAVGAAASLAQDYREGHTDFGTMSGNAVMHGAVNAVPGAVGLVDKLGVGELGSRLVTGLRNAGNSPNWLGTLTRTVPEALAEILKPIPKSTASTKILPGGLTAAGQANAANISLMTKLRALLGVASPTERALLDQGQQ